MFTWRRVCLPGLPGGECVYLKASVFTWRRVCLPGGECVYLEVSVYLEAIVFTGRQVCLPGDECVYLETSVFTWRRVLACRRVFTWRRACVGCQRRGRRRAARAGAPPATAARGRTTPDTCNPPLMYLITCFLHILITKYWLKYHNNKLKYVYKSKYLFQQGCEKS